MRRFLLLVCVFGGLQSAYCQFYLGNVAELFLSDGAVLSIEENAILDSFSILQNNGSILFDSNLQSDGVITNNGLVDVQGNVDFGGSVVNDGSSIWRFSGDSQQVSSVNPIQFGTLEFDGSGTKQLNGAVNCLRLRVQNCNVNTQNHELRVDGQMTDDVDAVNARIYSSPGGRFYRAMLANQEYVFPVGSESSLRTLKLIAFSDGGAGVRFSENGPGEEGVSLAFIDASLCSVGNDFHYRIFCDADSLSLSGSAELSWLQDRSIWAASRLAPQLAWSSIPTQVQTFGDSLRFSSTLTGRGEWALSEYSLRPEAPEILGPDTLCAGMQSVTYSIVGQPATTYLWTISAAGQSSSLEGSEIPIVWNGETGAGISVVASNADGCSSLPSSLNMHFNPLPVAAFEADLPSFPSTEDPIQFNNESLGSIVYAWNFGDESASEVQRPLHRFELPGIYSVTLIVSNEFGCSDTTMRVVEIPEDITLPNVFTPNDDGVNDVLEVPLSGIKTLSLTIFDRWGNVVFESSQTKLYWDGRNANGERMPAGTYFAVLKATGETLQFEKKQSIALMD
jgi:gliding motility-associated-like protein